MTRPFIQRSAPDLDLSRTALDAGRNRPENGGMDVPPRLPGIGLEVVEDHTATSRPDEGYLRVKRRSFVARYPGDPAPSAPFRYDVVERWNQDAVAVVLHFLRDGLRHVILRSALRVPLAMRPDPLVAPAVGLPEGAAQGELWEIPAGLVEATEKTAEGLVSCVIRETEEEVGLVIGAGVVHPLGGVLFPTAGVIGECIHLFHAEVDPSGRPEIPHGDGPLEKGARILEVRLEDALDWCDRGLLPDVKTEIGLRRFARLVAG